MEVSSALQAIVVQPAPPAGSSDAVTTSSSNIIVDALTHAGIVPVSTLLLLTLVSVVAWAIIAYKVYGLRLAQLQSQAFLDAFWGAQRLDGVYKTSESLPRSPIAQVFRAGYQELAKIKKRREAKEAESEGHADTQLGEKEHIVRALRRASLTELTVLEALVPFLGTVGATAPFVGLFGTVWGIMEAFMEIGRMGNANLATIAPGISEALITTAAGLVAAIPAVVAFNYFNNKIRLLNHEMDNFSSDFLSIVERHFFEH